MEKPYDEQCNFPSFYKVTRYDQPCAFKGAICYCDGIAKRHTIAGILGTLNLYNSNVECGSTPFLGLDDGNLTNECTCLDRKDT
jgi:hypothetical protein